MCLQQVMPPHFSLSLTKYFIRLTVSSSLGTISQCEVYITLTGILSVFYYLHTWLKDFEGFFCRLHMIESKSTVSSQAVPSSTGMYNYSFLHPAHAFWLTVPKCHQAWHRDSSKNCFLLWKIDTAEKWKAVKRLSVTCRSVYIAKCFYHKSFQVMI